MSGFNDDREFIVNLPVFYAKNVLTMLDNGASEAEAPVHLRVALAAAQRCPDMARYFLVQKCELLASNESFLLRS